MVWNTEDANSNLVSREDAQDKILALAQEQGYTGTFKVFYDGVLIDTPAALPAQVDMDLVRVSESLNQA